MDFRANQPIYLQIAEYVCEQILLDNWLPGSKILSIRDLAVLMEVTPNTIQKTYDFLQQKQIINNKRGIGYFIDDKGIDRVLTFRRQLFVENELPLVFRNLYLLNIPVNEFNKQFEEFVKKNFKK